MSKWLIQNNIQLASSKWYIAPIVVLFAPISTYAASIDATELFGDIDGLLSMYPEVKELKLQDKQSLITIDWLIPLSFKLQNLKQLSITRLSLPIRLEELMSLWPRLQSIEIQQLVLPEDPNIHFPSINYIPLPGIISMELAEKIAKCCPNLTQLIHNHRLDMSQPNTTNDEALVHIISDCHQIKFISLYVVTQTVIQAIFRNCRKLEELSIKDYHYQPAQETDLITLMSMPLPAATSTSHGSLEVEAVVCTSLKKLHMSNVLSYHHMIIRSLCGSSKLRSLHMVCCNLNSADILDLSTNCRLIEDLNISNNPSIRSDAMTRLMSQCPNITTLNISYLAYNIIGAVMRSGHKKLRVLIAANASRFSSTETNTLLLEESSTPPMICPALTTLDIHSASILDSQLIPILQPYASQTHCFLRHINISSSKMLTEKFFIFLASEYFHLPSLRFESINLRHSLTYLKHGSPWNRISSIRINACTFDYANGPISRELSPGNLQNLSEVVITATTVYYDVMDVLVKNCPCIKYLSILSGNLSFGKPGMNLIEAFPRLESLKIIYYDFDLFEHMMIVCKRLAQLRNLTVINCPHDLKEKLKIKVRDFHFRLTFE
jgi:hypothetical protein